MQACFISICGLIKFVLRQESSSSSEGEDIPTTEDLLKPESKKQQEDNTKTDQLFKDTVKRARMLDLYHQTATAKDKEAKEQHDRAKEERDHFRQSNADLRDQFETIWTVEKLKKSVGENFEYLEEIRTGRRFCQRHQTFQKSAQALFYKQNTDILTEDQLDALHEEMKLKWMETTQKHTQNTQYVWNVLLPELVVKIYSETFGFEHEEAELRIRETPERKSQIDGGTMEEIDRPKSDG